MLDPENWRGVWDGYVLDAWNCGALRSRCSVKVKVNHVFFFTAWDAKLDFSCEKWWCERGCSHPFPSPSPLSCITHAIITTTAGVLSPSPSPKFNMHMVITNAARNCVRTIKQWLHAITNRSCCIWFWHQRPDAWELAAIKFIDYNLYFAPSLFFFDLIIQKQEMIPITKTVLQYMVH